MEKEDLEFLYEKIGSVIQDYDDFIGYLNNTVENDRDEIRRLSTRVDLLEHLRLKAENTRTKMIESGKI